MPTTIEDGEIASYLVPIENFERNGDALFKDYFFPFKYCYWLQAKAIKVQIHTSIGHIHSIPIEDALRDWMIEKVKKLDLPNS